MNCKPGDIAVIVRTHPQVAFLRDRLVTVLDDACFDVAGFGPGWMVDGTLPMPASVNPLPGEVVGRRLYVPDAWLRPIRDPGDQAVDEMLTRAPKVNTTALHAYHETLSARDRQLWERAWDEAMGVR